MQEDSPKHIAILGAGPVGLEATLYARYLGHRVTLIEQGDVAHSLRRCGHRPLTTAFRENSTTLGIAALTAQDPDYRIPSPDSQLTASEWIEGYLAPLAASDLVADSLQTHTKVLSVSRSDLRKHDLLEDDAQAKSPFRILVRDESVAPPAANPPERSLLADIVLDCSGGNEIPLHIGPGGAPALGEAECAKHILYELPDLQGDHRARFAGHKTLVVGSSSQAVAAITELSALADQDVSTDITWLTTLPNAATEPGEINTDACAGTVIHACVASVSFDNAQQTFQVRLTTADKSEAEELEVDHIVALVGSRPDNSLFRELQVDLCYATEGPRRLASFLLGHDASELLADGGVDYGELLRQPEPNFYMLGAKSFGRAPGFCFAHGRQQIRALFQIIGERDTLDLYATARP